MKQRLVTATLVAALCCHLPTRAAPGDGYPIPAGAIRIGARELAAERLTDHLAELIAAESSDGGGVGGAPDDQPVPTALARLAHLLSAAERRKNRIVHESTGTSRFLSINRGAYFRGLLIVWLPVSFLLPTLAHHRKPYDDGPNLDGAYLSKRQSSVSNDIVDYDPDSSLFEFEPHYGPLLSRLEAYFHLMRVADVVCRWKLVCYASNRPHEFEPLSNLLRRLFERAQKRNAEPATYHPALKTFYSYVWAHKKGSRYSSPEQCDREYRQCPLPASALIRTDVLHFWQKLSERFAIQLQDE